MSISPITRCLNSAWRACVNADPWTKTAFVAGASLLTIRHFWIKRKPTRLPPPPPPPPSLENQPLPDDAVGPESTSLTGGPIDNLGRLARYYLGIPDLKDEGAANLILEAIKGKVELQRYAIGWRTVFSARLGLAEAVLDLDTCSLEHTGQIHDIVQKLWNERDPQHEIQLFDLQEGCTAYDLATAKVLVKEAINAVRLLPLPSLPSAPKTPLGELLSAHLEGEWPPLSEVELAKDIAQGHFQEGPSDQTRALRLNLLGELLKEEEIPPETLQLYDMTVQEIRHKDDQNFLAEVHAAEDIRADFLLVEVSRLLERNPLDPNFKVTPHRLVDPKKRVEGEATRQAKALLGEELAKVGKKLGEADNNGDCLFHAIGQQLNPPQTVKEIRQLVSKEVNEHPEKYRKLFHKGGGREIDTQAFEEYKQQIALTNDESSPPIWGESWRDGEIIARELRFRLNVYEFISEEERQQTGAQNIYRIIPIVPEPETVVEIANFSQHFVPILPLSD